MATRKVAFKDVTPTEERKLETDFPQPIKLDKPAVRPKLKLNLKPEFSEDLSLTKHGFAFQSQTYFPGVKDKKGALEEISVVKPVVTFQRKVSQDLSDDVFVQTVPQPLNVLQTDTKSHGIIRPSLSRELHEQTDTKPHGRQIRLSLSREPHEQTETKPHGRQVRPSVSREPNDVDDAYIQSIRNYQVDNWRHFFELPGRPRPGEISMTEIRHLLRNPLFVKDMDSHTIEMLQMKTNEPGRYSMTYQELVDLMSNKRTPSFRIAVDGQSKERLECLSRSDKTTCFQVMVRAVARNFLTDDVERQYYADRYNCCPPPIFVPVITLVEIGLFAYYCVENGTISHNGPVPIESYLIYRPDKRIEFWRFICYTFIHAGWLHLIFNMIVQIVVGIPLEMIHGCVRTAVVYMSGVLAGSLGTSIFDMKAYLVGASGGVYALLAAHLANIVLNYSNMELGILKLAAVLIIASADVGFAIWGRYSSDDDQAPIGYTAHLMGALAGLTIGLVVLKNFEQKLHDQYIWWIALAIYLGCLVFAICWNVLYY